MKLQGLDGLRGYMCLWVIISHTVTMAVLPLYKNIGIGRLITNGSFAVDVFIILSGFVITFLITQKKETYNTFIYRRVLRLFPTYIFALILSIFIFNLSIEFLYSLPWEHPKTENRLEHFTEAKKYFIENIISHLTLFHGIIPNSIIPNGAYAIIGQAWSFSLVNNFYSKKIKFQ